MGLVSSSFGRSLSSVWTLLVLGMAAAASMNATSTALHPLTQGLRDPELVEIPTYLLLVFVCIAIHELGHVAAAKMAGWRVRSITIGPLSYSLEKRRFAVVKRDAFRLISGFVTAIPPVDARRKSRGAILFVLGGCIANFVLATMTFPFTGQLQNNWDSNTVGFALLGSLSIVSVTMGIANLIPFAGFKGVRSDGLRLFEIATQKVWPTKAPAQRRKRRPA
jgi:Zn-dependent protease